MSNDVKIKVTMENATKPVIAGLKGDLHDVETASDKAGNKLSSIGERSKTVKGDLARLDDGIRSSTRALSDLHSALANTDDAAQRLDIRKAISKVQADLASSQKARKFKLTELFDLEPDGNFAQRLMGNISSALASAPPLAIAGGVIGAALAPSIAAGIGAGIAGGVGLAAIGGGVALIAKDPIIASNAERIGSTFKDKITKSARGAFEGPVVESLGKLETLANRSAPKIGKIFEATAPAVRGLTTNIVHLADSFMDDLVTAANNSGPAIDALGGILEHTGASVGDMISTLSEDAPAGASALEDLDMSLQNIIHTTTMFIDGLADIKSGADSFDEKIDSSRNSIEDFFTKMSGGRAVFDITADGYEHGTEAAKLYSEGIIGAKGSLNDYEHYLHPAAEGTKKLSEEMSVAEEAANGEKAALAGLANELKAQVDPVFGLLDASDKLTTAQKKYADSVKKSGKNSTDSKEALRDLAGAALDLEGKAGALGDTFNGTMTPALRNTLHAAGLTDKQIDELGKQFREAKRDGDRFAKNYVASAKVNGTSGASQKIRSITDDLRDFQGTWTATMITNYKTFGKPGSHGGLAHGGIKGAANGANSSGLTWVGENGPELADLPPGTSVHTAGDSQRMMKGAGGQGGEQALVIRLDDSGDAGLLREIVRHLRFEVSTQGGGSVQRTFGDSRVSA